MWHINKLLSVSLVKKTEKAAYFVTIKCNFYTRYVNMHTCGTMLLSCTHFQSCLNMAVGKAGMEAKGCTVPSDQC